MQNLRALFGRHREPLLFGAVGIFVMLMSFVELWFMESVLGLIPLVAYAIQTVISVEANFLLNHYITYKVKRHRVSFARAFLMFHATRVGFTVPVNLVLYPVLSETVLPWVFTQFLPAHPGLLNYTFFAAQTFCLALTFVVNYLVSKRTYDQRGVTVVRSSEPADKAGSVDVTAVLPISAKRPFHGYPLVSVVVPVRGSQDVIRRLVDSLLRQDYWEHGGRIETILVGSYNDPTWLALQDLMGHPHIRIVEANIVADGRDANPKRNIGLEWARGQILALTDSDMEMPDNWVRTGVDMLANGRHKVVAGSMISLGTGFWSDYVDKNVLGSKTPRMDDAYVIDQDTIGKPGYKLPITANVFLTRDVYEVVGGLHEQFTQTYDDYVWFSDMVAAGYSILCDARLAAYHRHREGFLDLPKEYRSAGNGCMDYMAYAPDDAFSRTRGRQLNLMLFAAVAGVLSLVFAPLAMIVAGMLAAIAVSTMSAVKTKTAAGFLYPAVTFILGLAFTYGIAHRLIRQSWKGVVLTETLEVRQISAEYSEAVR